MTNRIAEIRLIERVEMKFPYAARVDLTTYFGRNGRRHNLPSGGVVIQAIEQAIHPGRNGSTAHSREFPGLRNVRYRQYARYDFRINPRRRRLVPETKEGVGGKEELRRSEERRVGKEGVSTCKFRWSP